MKKLCKIVKYFQNLIIFKRNNGQKKTHHIRKKDTYLTFGHSGVGGGVHPQPHTPSRYIAAVLYENQDLFYVYFTVKLFEEQSRTNSSRH